MKKHWLAVLLVLVLAAIAIEVSEEVLEGESGAIDEAILKFIHGHVPVSLTGFFEAITFSGSSMFLLPVAAAATAALLWAGRRFEAMLLSVSVVVGAAMVYVIKAVAGRDRPALWDTDWYWGSSFPSGHTLVVAALATSAVLCADRIRPALHVPALAIAITWIVLVAFSRLVIGVHWPTDVLVAACIGAFLPLAISVSFELRNS